MSDPADKADLEIEQQLKNGIEQARHENRLPPKGECYNCGEPLPAPQRWCDSDCRDDFERLEVYRKGRGD